MAQNYIAVNAAKEVQSPGNVVASCSVRGFSGWRIATRSEYGRTICHRHRGRCRGSGGGRASCCSGTRNDDSRGVRPCGRPGASPRGVCRLSYRTRGGGGARVGELFDSSGQGIGRGADAPRNGARLHPLRREAHFARGGAGRRGPARSLRIRRQHQPLPDAGVDRGAMHRGPAYAGACLALSRLAAWCGAWHDTRSTRDAWIHRIRAQLAAARGELHSAAALHDSARAALEDREGEDSFRCGGGADRVGRARGRRAFGGRRRLAGRQGDFYGLRGRPARGITGVFAGASAGEERRHRQHRHGWRNEDHFEVQPSFLAEGYVFPALGHFLAAILDSGERKTRQGAHPDGFCQRNARRFSPSPRGGSR